MGLPEGNERRRFHGTKRACNLGDKGSTMLCSLPECSLCGIIKTSFKLSLAGTAHPWRRKAGRFGAGIYTSATSSKSNDYCKNLPSARSTCKAMLLTKVVAGNGEKLTKTDARRTGPSPGYDSVPRLLPFRYLNYDELVVYDEHAAIPAYLIMYESKT
ncbi:ADP-ribosylation [Gloeophyllum trabeum ATCC 11539]|uniref:ADP-ribosylation n=1 Tax=Gloeophyllum trabeum (strain ATCC 11539 / FP-39264 / Madison 617) TaxID=670483 RepID=S7Q1Z5_GLOTA|nr:ADP-ribosylation [Gloeophyllum trabeum ATCC 11539]EPQ53568.1 ADP-ribosylation [Gloeophyllum trabeum ATCC 11539]